MVLNNKAKALKNTLFQVKNEKNSDYLKIKNQKMNLEIIKFTKDHYRKKFHLFKKIQKRFFLNKYLLLPILEDLVDFTKYLRVHILILKKNHGLSDKKEINKVITDFFENNKFKNLNRKLNLIESENVILLENYLKNQKEEKKDSESFLKSEAANDLNFTFTSRKCLTLSLESYSKIYLNVHEFLKKNLNDYKQQYKRIVYCSEYLSLLKYFSLNFNKDFHQDKWRPKALGNIYTMFKKIELKFKQKIDSINKQFSEMTRKFSGSNAYLNNQIKYFQDKEEEIKKKTTLIEEGSSASKAQQEVLSEINFLQDIISFKTQISQAESNFFFLLLI